jgi:hypothetical protein
MKQLTLLLLWFASATVSAQPVVLYAPSTGDGAAGDFFGVHLYTDPEWLMVGAYGDLVNSVENFAGLKSGSVKVYQRTANGLVPTQTLIPPAPTPSTLFGDEVQRLGNRLAVSAPRFSSGAGGQEGGAVFLFALEKNLWVHQRTVVPPSAQAFGRFGESILLRDGELWVGAPRRGTGGEVFRYDLISNAFSPTATLAGSTAGARLGEAMVVIDQTQFGIGAPGAAQVLIYPFADPLIALDTLNGPPSFGMSLHATDNALVVASPDDGAGSVSRWIRDAQGWQAQPLLIPSEGANGDRFGSSLLIVGSRLYIGAPGTDRGSDFDVGAVYQASLAGADSLAVRTLPALASSTLFGSALVLDPTSQQILVGAPLVAVENQRSGQVLYYNANALGSPQAQPSALLDRGAGTQLFRFAQSVAIDGDTALGGAYLADTSAGPDAGAVHAFRFGGSNWDYDQMVVPNDATVDQRFALALDVSQGYAVVGAYWDVIAGRAEQGSAYVFRRDATGWVQDSKFVAANGQERDNFGAAVAIDGALIAVGARGANLTLVDQGAVNLYRRSGASWVSAGQLVAPLPEGGEFFGFAVAVCGDRVVVGAPGADVSPDFPDSGLAYVFDVPINGAPTFVARLRPSAAKESTNFGFAVSCSGAQVAVGAPGGGRVLFGGEVATFSCSARACAATDVLVMDDAQIGDQLGVAVALRGERLLAGISGRDRDGLFDVGAAALFERTSDKWDLLESIEAPRAIALGGFGRAVDIDDSRMVIGSPTVAGDNPAQGSMWIFEQPSILLRDGFE